MRIEVDLQPGLPTFRIVGLPDKRIDEARERVRAAIKNSGFSFPLGHLTVNLSPPDLPKQGTGFDLGIALAILGAAGKAPQVPAETWVFGELSLTGEIRPVARLGAMLVESVKRGIAGCLVPPHNQGLSRLGGAKLALAYSLKEVVDMLRRQLHFMTVSLSEASSPPRPARYALDDVVGQSAAKRAIELAVAGGHNLLMTGPPGSGKTMLAKAAIQLMPALSRQASQEVMQTYLISGSEPPESAPWRMPHHSISRAGLCGGHHGLPGELSLAHRGILFLDELPEYSREAKESLRQPLEDGEARMQRDGHEYVYPASCIVIAARNPCPCGLLGAEGEVCRCSPGDLVKHERKLSEPLLDRFALFCTVPKLRPEELSGGGSPFAHQRGETIAGRVEQARKRQRERVGEDMLNGRMSPGQVREHCRLERKGKELLEKAASQYYLSGRGVAQILKVCRTMADLEGESEIRAEHVQEALSYRRRVLKV